MTELAICPSVLLSSCHYSFNSVLNNRIQLPYKIFSTSLSPNPRSNSLWVRLRAWAWVDSSGKKVDFGQMGFEFGLLRCGPLPVDVLKEIKADAHVVNPSQFGHILDVIHIAVYMRIGLVWADQHGVHPDDATTLPHGAHVVIAAIAFDVIKMARVGV